MDDATKERRLAAARAALAEAMEEREGTEARPLEVWGGEAQAEADKERLQSADGASLGESHAVASGMRDVEARRRT